MIDGSELAVAGLVLLGGGAMGAALGGLVAGVMKWTGSAMHGAVATCVVAGAVVGLIAVEAPTLRKLGPFMARAQEAGEGAQMLAVLKAHYPDDYAAAMQALKTQQASGASPAQTTAALQRVGMPLMQRQLPLADTENALAALQLSSDQQKFLTGNPQLCFRMLMQPSMEVISEMNAAEPDELKQREVALDIRVLEQTATRPQSPRPGADLERKIRLWGMDSVGGLSLAERQSLRGMNSTPTDDQARAMCHAFGNLVGMLLNADRDDATEAFKSLSAKGMSRLTT